MPINFPTSPNNGDFHEEAGRRWNWDGSKWNAEAYITSSTVKEIRTVSADTTLLADDAGQIIRFTGTDPQTLTIPDALDPGSSVTVIQDNSGLVSFASSGSVNLLSSTGTFESLGQNSVIDILCVADSEYRLSGNLLAVEPFVATGGIATTSGEYTIHTFTSSGSFSVTSGTSDVDYIVVAGGGGGGNTMGGGGGAGGLQAGSLTVSSGEYTVTVGSGGVGATNRNITAGSGTSSSFSTISSTGGGGGASWGGPAAATGGSGGGAPNNKAGAAGTQGQGNSGGGSSTNGTGGGGGGAGSEGFGGSALGNFAGRGGVGVSSLITGTTTFYAGGGGGGGGSNGGYPAADRQGGNGGGGNGGNSANGSSGTTNTGGGGGGGGYGPGDYSGASGGSGIVVIRYLTNA